MEPQVKSFSSAASPMDDPASYSNALPSYLRPLGSVLDRFQSWRVDLNLPHPGKTEDLGAEVRNTHATQAAFDGAKAELTKILSDSPRFQVTHSFALGSQGGPMGGISPGTYSFNSVLASNSTVLTGFVQNDGSLQGRFIHAFTPSNTVKLSTQFAPFASQSSLSFEYDRTGSDYALNLSANNPSPTDLTGVYIASYLQSITPHFALGVDATLQRPRPDIEDVSLAYHAKWHNLVPSVEGNPAGGKGSWTGTAQILQNGAWLGTYHQKLAERVEAGVELLVIPAPNPAERKAYATVGLKYEFRMAKFRGQIDSGGKVIALLESQINPIMSLALSSEVDHMKNTSKFGMGITIESADQELMEQQQQLQQAQQQQAQV